MNLYRQALALLLVATFITAECTYAKPKRVVIIDAPSTRMTVREARKSLIVSLSDLQRIKSVQEVKFNRLWVKFVDNMYSGERKDCFVAFAEMKNLSVETVKEARGGSIVGLNGKPLVLGPGLEDKDWAWFKRDAARKFVDAMLTLKEAALAPDTEEADFTAFTANAKTWLAATPKPEMSEEARTYKVLAEDAFERKDVTAALDAFCGALDKYPMWPKGQYNAAVLAAEAEDFELAAHHMRRYLVLAPDAKDAAAAKDRLLLWQHKAKE